MRQTQPASDVELEGEKWPETGTDPYLSRNAAVQPAIRPGVQEFY